MNTTAELLRPAQDVEPSAVVEEKALQIMQGAWEVFLRQGFDGASMNDVAKAAGVSKGTIYVYFSSKEALFEALIRRNYKNQAEKLVDLDENNPDVEAMLVDWALSLVEVMLTPDHIAQVRMVIGAGGKFPSIGQAFYEAGPCHGLDRLSRYFRHHSALGALDTPDPELAATQFVQLCAGHITKRVLFCADDAGRDWTPVVRAGVAVFMRFYGVKAA